MAGLLTLSPGGWPGPGENLSSSPGLCPLDVSIDPKSCRPTKSPQPCISGATSPQAENPRSRELETLTLGASIFLNRAMNWIYKWWDFRQACRRGGEELEQIIHLGRCSLLPAPHPHSTIQTQMRTVRAEGGPVCHLTNGETETWRQAVRLQCLNHTHTHTDNIFNVYVYNIYVGGAKVGSQL